MRRRRKWCRWACLPIVFPINHSVLLSPIYPFILSPLPQYIPPVCRNTLPSEINKGIHINKVGGEILSIHPNIEDSPIQPRPKIINKRTLLRKAQLKRFLVPDPIFGDKTSWHKRKHILPCCLTDNSPLNDLLLGVNYANDVQTNSSWGQLRQPLISGQFSSCFTDIQLKIAFEQARCLVWQSWHSAEQRWAGTRTLFWWGRAKDHGHFFFCLFKMLHVGFSH